MMIKELFLLLLIISSCNNPESKKQKPLLSQAQVNDSLIKSTKRFLKLESEIVVVHALKNLPAIHQKSDVDLKIKEDLLMSEIRQKLRRRIQLK